MSSYCCYFFKHQQLILDSDEGPRVAFQWVRFNFPPIASSKVGRNLTPLAMASDQLCVVHHLLIDLGEEWGEGQQTFIHFSKSH